MLTTIRKGVSSQIKAVGRSMDQLGAMIEPNPYHEKGKFIYKIIMNLLKNYIY